VLHQQHLHLLRCLTSERNCHDEAHDSYAGGFSPEYYRWSAAFDVHGASVPQIEHCPDEAPMSLHGCKSCGGDVSNNARVCPHCGEPNHRGTNWGCLLLVLGILFFYMIAKSR
jgi:hypothetical protein